MCHKTQYRLLIVSYLGVCFVTKSASFLQCTQEEVRSVINFSYVFEKKIVCWNSSNYYKQAYSDNVIDIWKVRRWCMLFKEGRTNVFNEGRGGPPVTASKDDNIQRVEQLILEDRHVHIVDFAGSHAIVHNRLSFHKVSARWVPKLFIKTPKNIHMGISLVYLTRYQQDDRDFLSRNVTEDKMWIAYCTPEQKRHFI